MPSATEREHSSHPMPCPARRAISRPSAGHTHTGKNTSSFHHFYLQERLTTLAGLDAADNSGSGANFVILFVRSPLAAAAEPLSSMVVPGASCRRHCEPKEPQST